MSGPGRSWINGRAGGDVSAFDRGLQYGDGLFETLAVRDGQPLLWAQHLARLQAGCRRLLIPAPDEQPLLTEALAVCREETRAVLKIIVTRGVGGRGYRSEQLAAPTRILNVSPWPAYDPAWRATGVAARLCQTRLGRNPRLAGIKHLNRLEQVLARREWGDDFAEGVMQDDAGLVIEGVMSNLFIIHQNRLLTPDLTACGVAGVMRGQVLSAAEQLGLETCVGPLTLEDLGQAEEMFFTNCLIGIWPVRRFEGYDYPLGNVTQMLQSTIRDMYCHD